VTIKHWRFLLVGWLTFIFLASSSLFSADHTKDILVFDLLNFIVRKSAHIVEYAILTFLWFRSLWTVPERFKSYVIWSVGLSVLYAISDEWHQSFVPNRLGTWEDVVWDAVGAVFMGVAIGYLYKQNNSKIKQRILGPLSAFIF
jgi:hypothetical protein